MRAERRGRPRRRPRLLRAAAAGRAPPSASVLIAGTWAAADEGHDHGTEDVATWPDEATVDADHDHSDAHSEDHSDDPTHEPADDPAHDHAGVPGDDPAPVPSRQRPRELVLGSFAVVNVGVLLAAALLRRRTARGRRSRGRSVR